MIEICHERKKHIIGVIYRPNTAPKADINIFALTQTELLNIINLEKKTSVIMGDFNVDLLHYPDNNANRDYIDTTVSLNFIPVITKPTRVTDHSATLIDQFYTNDIPVSNKCGIIITDVSDHFGIYYIPQLKTNSESKEVHKEIRPINDNNITLFKSLINSHDFASVYNCDCPNEAYNICIESIELYFEQAFPTKRVKLNKNNKKREPWITKGLMISSNRKAILFKKKMKQPTVVNIDIYRKYNTLFNKVRRTMKKLYYDELFSNSKSDIKKTWNEIRKLLLTKPKNSLPNFLELNGIQITDKQQIADKFNDYFANIGLDIQGMVPETNKMYNDYMPEQINASMFLIPTDPGNVIDVGMKLRPKSSSGYDNISTKLLRKILEDIAIPFSHVANLTFTTGNVPQKLKLAKVIPIFKSGNKYLMNNYRPISLLPSFSKLLEKLVYNRMIKFIEHHNILYEHQYGFRKKTFYDTSNFTIPKSHI